MTVLRSYLQNALRSSGIYYRQKTWNHGRFFEPIFKDDKNYWHGITDENLHVEYHESIQDGWETCNNVLSNNPIEVKILRQEKPINMAEYATTVFQKSVLI